MNAFLDAIVHRRSRYALSAESPVPDSELAEMLEALIKNLPTAYNMQGTRAVLLLGNAHKRLWDIVLETLKPRVPEERFPMTQTKIGMFAAGHGSVLLFNDDAVTKEYMKKNPAYADNFPGWVLQQSGMLQLAVWAALDERGLGVTIQHYNPIIDDAVKKEWNLPESWALVAQMAFGKPTAPAGQKTFVDMAERFKVFD